VTIPDDLDPSLWIEVEGVAGRCYLIGNPHTFRGRMYAYSEGLARDLAVSRADIRNSSTEARYWVEGFLSGNEPDGDQMFGPAFLDQDDRLAERWQNALSHFTQAGNWPYGDWILPLPFPAGCEFVATPWFLRADEIWTWSPQGWIKKEPQPLDPPDYLPPGTHCRDEGHSMATVTDCHLVCDQCGMTLETTPEQFSYQEWAEIRPSYTPVKSY
jgi:hypothetical protein